jgi:hypothetical protein
MIESQKELPLRGALSSRHCEERMSPKQSRIKIPGGEENAAWPGQEMFFVIARSRDSSFHSEEAPQSQKGQPENEAGVKNGFTE